MKKYLAMKKMSRRAEPSPWKQNKKENKNTWEAWEVTLPQHKNLHMKDNIGEKSDKRSLQVVGQMDSEIQ